ncbi:MAG: large conductance mechanosensitive channel protein MscL [Saprospiraceae bacterium]|nr:large conductance mechanosensitive channel protein MscL [Saprospiraceae bacterium]
MLREFKQFIMRGNVIDLAVAVIIGGAFQKIIDSVVTNLIMPLVGIALGGIDFSKETIVVGEVTLNWGLVFQAVVDFILVAFVLFLILKAYNASQKQETEAPATPSATETLLADIKKIMENIDAKTK